MTGETISSANLSTFQGGVRARWAPLLLEPVAGSDERLVIGVVVVGADSFHVEFANALERLKCLYSDSAPGSVYAIQLAVEHLNQDLSRRAVEAISDPKPTISGISIGECREAEGESLEAIGKGWMSALSSLYSSEPEAMETPSSPGEDELEGRSHGGRDRLPMLVMNYVSARREGFAQFFSSDLREGRRRRANGRRHEVLIDFSGSRLVASFGTLQVAGLPKSISLIKGRLWDLKVARDGDPTAATGRRHEMILRRPPLDDPKLTGKQQGKLSQALEALESQADQEQLRLRALNSIAEIGDHILSAEAA
jgi:hypothetical protein